MNLPSGTVTFLFSDIEGSTKLWEQHPEAMRSALARHDALLRIALESNNGVIFKTIGDAFCAAFPTAPDALSAALTAQRALHAELWQDSLSLRVRMALHTGAAELRDNDYFGQPLNRVARLLAAGHGGQVLLSDVAHDLCRDALPTSVSLKNLGEHRLRDLARPEPVFQLCHPELPSEFPPLKSLDNPELPNNLPMQVTSFIGREKEIAAVKALLAKTRLLTLTGSGGCGKTRLSLQVAAEVLEEYPDGVWLVEFAPLADPDLVPQAVAQALRVKEEPGKSVVEVITAFLKTKHLLLVLDNCEHLLDACARLVETLLRVCPGMKALASSREGLGLAGEQSYRVPSLSLPDPRRRETAEGLNQYEAVLLFIERAKLSRSDFTMTNADAPALAQLCHRLDGIPLAIELAAARVRSLSVEEINARLDNRFRLLTGGSRTALPRQQTLRALIDWSYDLLNPQEKALLHRLSVFSGGWTLEAVEQVCAGEDPNGETIEEWETLDLLTGLVDKSLALAETRAGHTRYRLLETVRQYARERLLESGEAEAVWSRHCDHFLSLVHTLSATPSDEEGEVWERLMEREYDNVRAALDFCLGDSAYVEAGLRAAVALYFYWWLHFLPSEGYALLQAFVSHPETQAPTLLRGQAVRRAGYLAYWQGEFAIAIPLVEEGLTLARQHGYREGVFHCLSNLGGVYISMGQPERARPFFEEGLAVARELELAEMAPSWLIGSILSSMSNVCRLLGEYEAARRYAEEMVALKEEGWDWYSHLALAPILVSEGRLPEARERYLHSLSALRSAGDWRRVLAMNVLERLAALDVLAGRWEQAACLFGACEAYRDAIHSPLSLSDHAEFYDAALTGLRAALDADAFTAAWEKGRQMPFSQALEYALEEAEA